jgi:hypothetical protein
LFATGVRSALHRWRPILQTLPHQSRIAVRYARLALRAAPAVTGVALALIGVAWTIGERGWPLIAAGALMVAIGPALAVYGLLLLHRNVAPAGQDLFFEPPTPMILHWRFRILTRLAGATAAVLAAVLLVIAGWYAQPRLASLLVAAWMVRLWVGNPWPVASTYPYLGSIGPSGLTIEPLHLVVPWSAISRIGVGATRIEWFLRDPASVVAAAPLSPRQKRNLTRLLNERKGAIAVGAWRLRQPVEDIYRASARYHSAQPAWR